MALVLADRIKETTATTGTGTVTLAGASTGFQSFAVIGNGNTTYYTISGGAQWEVGIGTYTASGTTLSRDTVLSSSSAGAKVSFSAGTKDVFVTYPADKAISNGYGTLPIANGGTGTTTQFTTGSVVFAGASGVYSQDNANLFWDDTNNRLGIGTSSPSTKLEVAGSGDQVAAVNSTATGASFVRLVSSTQGLASFNGIQSYYGGTLSWSISGNGGTDAIAFNTGSSNTERMRITSAGNVGIGTSSPSYQLQLSTNSAAKPTSNVWTVASDERVKTVTGEYTKGLDAVCSLRPVTYKYNGKAGFVADGSENISIIAQEAMEAFPECIGTFSAKLNETDEEETELLNWDGHALTFALVNAIKELKAQNEDLRTRIAALEAA